MHAGSWPVVLIMQVVRQAQQVLRMVRGMQGLLTLCVHGICNPLLEGISTWVLAQLLVMVLA